MKIINLLLLLFIGLLFSCKTTAPQASNQIENALLWKIDRNDIQPSYVYGTIHLLPKSDFKMAIETEQAFKDANQIILELDMDDPGMMASMMKFMMMEDGNSLKEMMSEAAYTKADSILTADMGAGLSFMDNVKPFMIMSMLIPSFMDEIASYEETFIKMAKEQDKEILGIETVEAQMNAIDASSYEDQVTQLEEMLIDETETMELFSTMVAMYKDGKITDLHDMVKSEYEDESALNAMLYERNRNWVSAIPDLCAEKSSFIAVGAGHLGGELGVINLLKKEGYTVTPVLFAEN